MRLDQALARMLPEHSRARLKGWIEAGHVKVDDLAWEPRRRVAGGERIAVDAPAPAASIADTAEDIALEIVFEDDAILVVDKPAGLVVHPGSGNRAGTLLNALLHHDAGLAAIPRAGIVHRLDKDTSGLMVVAKTIEAQTDLVRQLAAHRVAREYLAVAYGDIVHASVVDAPIAWSTGGCRHYETNSNVTAVTSAEGCSPCPDRSVSTTSTNRRSPRRSRRSGS